MTSRCRIPTLQWGHGDEAVEENTKKRISKGESRLQWGHGDEAVEESQEGSREDLGRKASMGPRR